MSRVRVIGLALVLLATGAGSAGCFGQQPARPAGDTTSYSQTVTAPTQSATTTSP
jgi:hypothetical protein